jgi:hypothetical protein
VSSAKGRRDDESPRLENFDVTVGTGGGRIGQDGKKSRSLLISEEEAEDLDEGGFLITGLTSSSVSPKNFRLVVAGVSRLQYPSSVSSLKTVNLVRLRLLV